MCEGDNHGDYELGDPSLKIDHDVALVDRRHFLQAGVVTAAALAIGHLVDGRASPAEAAQAPVITSYDGLMPYANAMHIHSSSSEQKASLEAQVSEAFANKTSKRIINPTAFVVWPTEHDWREMAHTAPTHIAFTSLTKELVGGKPVLWQDKSTGSFAQKTIEVVTNPVSPYDTTPNRGAMHVAAQGANTNAAETLVWGNFDAQDRLDQRTNLDGQTLSIDVLPTQADGTNSYLEVRLNLSYRPAQGGRPAGQYQLSYRLGATPAAYETQQILGIVHKQVTPGEWQQVAIDPIADIKQLWPDTLAEDNSLQDIWLGANSLNQQPAEGYFGNLQFARTKTAPADILTHQQTLKDTLAAKYPGIYLPRGREISYFERHVNAFGPGAEYFADYSPYPNVLPNRPGWDETTHYVQQVQALGGLASFNHPFGTNATLPNPVAQEDAALLSVFADTYAHDLGGADILEVGYQERGGSTVDGGTKVVADINHHLALWDMHTRNSRWVTGTGVSDNHTGGVGEWAKEKNRFLTYPWAASPQEADLLAALGAGRAYVGELGSFAGLLDMQVDGEVSMGQVSVRPDLTSRALKLIAMGLPAKSLINIVQGPIDNPGTQTSGPGTVVVETLPASAFTTGNSVVQIDTSAPTFVRMEVVTSAGRKVAFTNPIYLLNGTPARAVPANRLSADSIVI